MDTAAWIVQALLALAFLMAGVMKATQPREKLAERMTWVEDFSPRIVKGIGTLEVLGAVGVILPALTGILPWLTPLAAAGLILTMIGAMLTHIRRGELSRIGANVVLLMMATFVIYARFVAVPIMV